MAEEPETKDEEKFELDAAGDALDYIYLDQSRLLAMEHARDNLDFYGRRYARRELVWEVLSQEESEDAGTKIAFQSERDGNFEIYAMNAAGANETRFTTNATRDAAPHWRP